MSTMLMGLVPLFSSCVDGDYYDLYENEEEIISPRSKKGRDIPSDLSAYPMMNDDWHETETVTCCFSNIYGIDKIMSRFIAIETEFGSFNETNYYKYFSRQGAVSKGTADRLLGTNERSAESFAVMCVNSYQGGTMTFPKLAVYSNDYTHVSVVTGIHVENTSTGGYVVYVDMKDQYGYSYYKYNVVLDSRKKLVSKTLDCFLYCN